jgi:Fur family ferric uptake transcriptional regulator
LQIWEKECFEEGVLDMSLESKKRYILEELRRNGCRITNQRQILIDIILQDECDSCKAIYYQANKADPSIGLATIYRLVKTLEETGLIQRKNLYQIDCGALTAGT